ncbi:MAG: hypothetical protein HW386_2120 [Gammaproteobacteria bacterium]|nr:hypothetical protein [Gammaproteobacteria bacterium]
MRVIKGNQVIEDNWLRLDMADEAAPLPPGDIIVPYAYWKTHRQQLLHRTDGLFGICIYGDDAIEEVAADLQHFRLIALDFPIFRDGRNYSHARLLRERYGYQGELRAVGDVLRDQLFFLRRCGIDAFQIREDKDIEDAIKGFSDFSITYQTAADGKVPVYKNR